MRLGIIVQPLGTTAEEDAPEDVQLLLYRRFTDLLAADSSIVLISSPVVCRFNHVTVICLLTIRLPPPFHILSICFDVIGNHLDLLFWPHKPQDAKCNKKGKRLALLRLSRVILLCHRASNLSLSLFISFVTREDESVCRDLDNVTRTERIGWFWHSVTAR